MAVPRDRAGVTAAWLHELLGTDDRFSDARWGEVTFERIGEGFGLDGLLLRATLPGATVPTVVVKTADWPSPSEPYFYQQLSPQIPLRFASYYASTEDANGRRYALVIEDLQACSQGDCLVGATDTQTQRLVEAIAKVHGRFWGASDPLLHPVRRHNIDADVILSGFDAHQDVFLARHSRELGPEAKRAYRQVADGIQSDVVALQAATPTFIHWDLHLDNVMFDGGEPIILDWPGGRVGPPVLDLVRILVEGMTLDQRRQRQDWLITHYLQSLSEEGVDLTRDELDTQIDAAAMWACWSALSWCISIGDDISAPRTEALLRNVVTNAFSFAADRRG